MKLLELHFSQTVTNESCIFQSCKTYTWEKCQLCETNYYYLSVSRTAQYNLPTPLLIVFKFMQISRTLLSTINERSP